MLQPPVLLKVEDFPTIHDRNELGERDTAHDGEREWVQWVKSNPEDEESIASIIKQERVEIEHSFARSRLPRRRKLEHCDNHSTTFKVQKVTEFFMT